MTLAATLAHAVQQTQEWLKELRDNGELANESGALSVLRTGLHQLRDRLTTEAVDLAAQLPLVGCVVGCVVGRGVYFEGWRPGRTPETARSKEESVEGVKAKLRPHTIAPEPAVRDVLALATHHCGPAKSAL
ncbi:MAG: DUF2267 domain-containing protein [Hyphomicrobiaceae bacterium]|nr:DUF2267 domain-containing protein [Hyphomicrobiaceae bacterium]